MGTGSRGASPAPDEAWCLRYAAISTGHGRLLILMSDVGVVDVIVGRRTEELLQNALRRYPDVGFIPDRGRHADWVEGVRRRFDSEVDALSVPLDLRQWARAG